MPDPEPIRFAYFITPHGYGHAARACAVMNAIPEYAAESAGMVPARVEFEIFTRVPIWFFNMSLREGFRYHEVLTDVGLAQATSMEEDLPETIRRLNDLFPYREDLVDSLAAEVKEAGCRMVICDIAPLGIAVAKKAGLPSVLIENFTWDWIYEGYVDQEPRFEPFIHYLKGLFGEADYHIRTIPACDTFSPADMLSAVVSRKPRQPREATRQRLGVSADKNMVMITMGGILTEYPFLDRLVQSSDTIFLVPGGSDRYETRGSMVLIPHHSDFYHPDLVAASDAVIGKLGYSTLAEVCLMGVPYAYIPRERFPESLPMGNYAREEIGAVELNEARFFSGEWLDLLPDLLARPKRGFSPINGADQIADQVLKMVREAG